MMKQNGEVVDCRPTWLPSPFVQYKKASAMWIQMEFFSMAFHRLTGTRAPLMLINVNFSTNNLKTNRISFSFLTTTALSLSFISAILKPQVERVRILSLRITGLYFRDKAEISHKFPWKENCKLKENLKLETSQHHLNNNYKCEQ